MSSSQQSSGFPRPTPPVPPDVIEEEAEEMEATLAPHATLYQRVVRVLDVGQVVSAVLILLGLALILIAGDNLPRETIPASKLPEHLADLEGDAVLDLGILAIILTPVVYVVFSLVTFIQKRDRIFMGVTSVLIGILVASVVLASI